MWLFKHAGRSPNFAEATQSTSKRNHSSGMPARRRVYRNCTHHQKVRAGLLPTPEGTLVRDGVHDPLRGPWHPIRVLEFDKIPVG